MTILAIDLGTSAVKFLRADANLSVTAVDRIPASGLDVDHWLAVLHRTIAEHGDGDRIETLVITGQMHGLLTREAGASGDPIPWTDQRAAAFAADLNAELGPEIATIGGPLASGFLATSLAWILHHDPNRWRRIRQVMLPKDALIHALTGRHVTDPTDAAGSGLLDIASRRWYRPLLDRIGIPDAWLPEIVPSGSDVGPLCPDIARRLGLPVGTRVVIAGGDAPVGAFGAGITNPGDGLILLSSGAQLILPAPAFVPDTSGRWYTWPSAGGTAPVLRMGTLLNAGIAVDWAARLGNTPSPGEPTSLIVLPQLTGERTPLRDPDRRGTVLGLTPDTTAGDIFRATLEGVAFGLRHALEVMCETLPRPGELRVGGGGASIPGWPAIIANVLALPVRTIDSQEVTAFGAAALAAGMAAPVSISPPITPDPHLCRQYEIRYRLYHDALDVTAPLSGRLAGLSTPERP